MFNVLNVQIDLQTLNANATDGKKDFTRVRIKYSLTKQETEVDNYFLQIHRDKMKSFNPSLDRQAAVGDKLSAGASTL